MWHVSTIVGALLLSCFDYNSHLIESKGAEMLMRTSIREFTTPAFPVYMFDANGSYKVETMGEVRIINRQIFA